MDTNLITAKIVLVVVTNWITYSRTTPVINNPAGMTYAVIRYDTLNQQGVISTNRVARFDWKGTTHEVLLETVGVSDQKVERSIAATSGLSLNQYKGNYRSWISVQDAQVALDFLSDWKSNHTESITIPVGTNGSVRWIGTNTNPQGSKP